VFSEYEKVKILGIGQIPKNASKPTRGVEAISVLSLILKMERVLTVYGIKNEGRISAKKWG